MSNNDIYRNTKKIKGFDSPQASSSTSNPLEHMNLTRQLFGNKTLDMSDLEATLPPAYERGYSSSDPRGDTTIAIPQRIGVDYRARFNDKGSLRDTPSSGEQENLSDLRTEAVKLKNVREDINKRRRELQNQENQLREDQSYYMEYTQPRIQRVEKYMRQFGKIEKTYNSLSDEGYRLYQRSLDTNRPPTQQQSDRERSQTQYAAIDSEVEPALRQLRDRWQASDPHNDYANNNNLYVQQHVSDLLSNLRNGLEGESGSLYGEQMDLSRRQQDLETKQRLLEQDEQAYQSAQTILAQKMKHVPTGAQISF